MSELDEYSCFVGNLSLSTTAKSLKLAFKKFGHISNAKVLRDKFGRSCSYGFVKFKDKKSVEDAIKEMDGTELGNRLINVEKARQRTAGRDRHGNREHDRDPGGNHDRGRDYGGGRGSKSGMCLTCGKRGHSITDCFIPVGPRGGAVGQEGMGTVVADCSGARNVGPIRGWGGRGGGRGHYGPDPYERPRWGG